MRLPDDHAFFRVPRTPFRTSAGIVELPILYHDVSSVLGLFRAPIDSVRALLDGSGLEVALTVGREALVALAFYEYRRTSVGAYNEVGVATFVKRAGDRAPRMPWLDLYRNPDQRTIGATIFDLPVTTSIANAAGRELWGYPKFVTPISFRLSGGSFEGVVEDPDHHGEIVSLSGSLGASLPAPPMSLMLYSHAEGRLLRTNVNVRGRVRAHGRGGAVLRVGASHHPMAERLRRLGLDGARPVVVMTTHEFQSRLHAGVVVEGATAPTPRAVDTAPLTTEAARHPVA